MPWFSSQAFVLPDVGDILLGEERKWREDTRSLYFIVASIKESTVYSESTLVPRNH
jgi:hypothetical protein